MQNRGLRRALLLGNKRMGPHETEFNIALQAVGFGDMDSLCRILEKAKADKVLLREHLFNRGQMTTRAGAIVKHTTLLEAAILGLDPEIAAVIMPYYSEVDGGEEELESQLTRCRPCIDAMIKMMQEPWEPPKELAEALAAIKAAPAQDVMEELNTGEKYNKAYQSSLRHALDQWRQEKLAPANRVINVLRAPRVHCNPCNWIYVCDFFDNEWVKNQWNDLVVNVGGNDKIYLILRQLRGLEELAEFTPYLRFAFANDQVLKTPEQITRSVKFKNGYGIFPDFNSSSIESHSGLAFDFYVSIHGVRVSTRTSSQAEGCPSFTNLCRTTALQLQELCGGHNSPQPRQQRVGV